MCLHPPKCTFPFLPLPSAIITERVIQLGREEEKKEGKGGDLMCLCLLCLLFWAPLLTNKQCPSLAPYHIFSKLQNEHWIDTITALLPPMKLQTASLSLQLTSQLQPAR